VPLVSCQNHHPRVHETAFVAEGAYVVGNVALGRDVSVWFNAVLRADINGIIVGDRTNIQDGCVLHVTNQCEVRIGSEVTIGHRAIIHGCTIGDASLIGMGAIVLDHARVEPNALVAAGAVVLEGMVVPEGSLVAGVPARVIRKLSEEEKAGIRRSAANYVVYAKSLAR